MPPTSDHIELGSEADAYAYACQVTPTCNREADTHGLECERINDLARNDHYVDLLLSTPLGAML